MEQLKLTMATWADRKLVVKNYEDGEDIRIEISRTYPSHKAIATYLTRAQVRDLIKFLQEIENNS